MSGFLDCSKNRIFKRWFLYILKLHLILLDNIVNDPTRYIFWFFFTQILFTYPLFNAMVQNFLTILNSNGKSVKSLFPDIGEHLVVPLVSVILIINNYFFNSMHVPKKEQKSTCSFLTILKKMVVPLGCLMFGEFLNFHVTSFLTSKINAGFSFLSTSNHSDRLFLALRIFNLKQNISYLTELKFGKKNINAQCDNNHEGHDTEFIQFQENSNKNGLVMFYDFCINDFPHTMALRMTNHYNIRVLFVNPLIVLLSKLVLVMFSWSSIHREFLTRLIVETFSQYVFTLVFMPSLVTLAYKLNYLFFFSNSSCLSSNAGSFDFKDNTCFPRLLLEWIKIVLIVQFINSFHIFNTLHTDIGDHLDSQRHGHSHSFQIYDFLSDLIEFSIFVGLIWSILYFTLEFYKLNTVEQRINMELDELEQTPFLISKTPEYHMVNVFENIKDLNENNIKDFIGYIDDDNDENNGLRDDNTRNIKSQIIIHKTHELEILEPFSKKIDLNRKVYLINNNFSISNNESIILLKMELSTGGDIKNEKLLTLVYNNGTLYIFNLKLGRWLTKEFKLNIRNDIKNDMGHTNFQIKESFFKNNPKQDIQYILVDNHGEMHTITIWNTESYNKDVIRYTSNRISQTPIVHCCKMITERMNDRLIFSTTDGEIYVCQEIVNRPWKSRPLVVIDNTFNIIGTQLLTPRNLKMRFSPVTSTSTSTTSTSTTNTQKRYPVNSEIFNLSHFGFTFILNKSTFKGELVDVQTGTLIKTFNIDPNIILSSTTTTTTTTTTTNNNTSFQIYSDMEPTFCKFCGSCAISKLCISYNVRDIPTTTNPSILLKTHVFKIDKKNKKFICLRVERDPREIRCLGLDSVIEKIYYNSLSNCIDNNTISTLLLTRPTPTSSTELNHDHSDIGHSRDEFSKITGLVTRNIFLAPSSTCSFSQTTCHNNKEESLLIIDTKNFKHTEYPIMRNVFPEYLSSKNTSHSLEQHNQVTIKPFIQTNISSGSSRSSRSSNSFLMVQNSEGNKLNVVYSVV